MQSFARPLGDAAKKARAAINLTQRQVAGRIGADARSVLNIENYKGNPKMQILFPPVRELQIDAREVFHPKMGRKHHVIRHQCFAVEACDEALAEALLPVVESVLKILHEKNAAKSGGLPEIRKACRSPKDSRLSALWGHFFDWHHFELCNSNQGFFLAFGATEWKVDHHRVRPYLGAGLVSANQAARPKGFFVMGFHVCLRQGHLSAFVVWMRWQMDISRFHTASAEKRLLHSWSKTGRCAAEAGWLP